MLITNFLAKKSHAIFETVAVEAYIGRKIYKYSEYIKYLVNSQALTSNKLLHLLNQIPTPYMTCGNFSNHNIYNHNPI